MMGLLVFTSTRMSENCNLRVTNYMASSSYKEKLGGYQLVKVELADVNDLSALSQATFLETFAADNLKENIEKYVHERLSPATLSVELMNDQSEFYFLKFDNQIVGYLKVNFNNAQTELLGHDRMELERIYVIRSHHGKGAGQVLLEKAFSIGREHNVAFIWLGVWEKNVKAIQFYKKNGFEQTGSHDFTLGEDIQTDIIMSKKLD
jgi:diamine N-acetyltransferase